MKKKSTNDMKPRVHQDLNGFDIYINEFGEIESTFPIEQLNQFLNKKVVDKKLKDRFGFKSDENDDTIDFMYDREED